MGHVRVRMRMRITARPKNLVRAETARSVGTAVNQVWEVCVCVWGEGGGRLMAQRRAQREVLTRHTVVESPLLRGSCVGHRSAKYSSVNRVPEHASS